MTPQEPVTPTPDDEFEKWWGVWWADLDFRAPYATTDAEVIQSGLESDDPPVYLTARAAWQAAQQSSQARIAELEGALRVCAEECHKWELRWPAPRTTPGSGYQPPQRDAKGEPVHIDNCPGCIAEAALSESSR